jgi:hypothetical protein
VENCLTVANPYLCLIFVGPEGAHAKRDHVLAAKQDLEAVLAARPNDLLARWLLNVSAMLAGDYPAGVDPRWLIPPERFASSAPAPRFRNVARALGVDHVGLVGGAVMEDLDGDGDLDLFSTSYDPCVPVSLYLNDGRGGFTDATAEAGLRGVAGGFNVAPADYDNDGRTDLYITRGGWQADAGRMRPSLLHNDGDGRFSDVAVAAGLAQAVYPTQTSVWADYDADGDVDLFLGNEQSDLHEPYPSQLYRNNGDGTFTDVAGEAGVDNKVMVKGAAWGDYDNDRDPDLYVSNIGPNRLYRNNGDGTFTDVAEDLGVTEPTGRSFVPWFFDYDNDGWLDLFVGAYDTSIQDLAAYYAGQPGGGSPPRLYHNKGDGTFEDVTQAAGLVRPMQPMGANFGDIDNDGFEDFYLGTGDPAFETIKPNLLFRNDGAGRFDDVTQAAGVGHLPKGHGIAFGDLDNDGDQDIYLEAGGFVPGDTSPDALFENPGSGNHWLTVKLVGEGSNRAAIGTRLTAVVDEAGRERSIHRVVGTGASFGANSLQQELGLGQADRIVRLEVHWPTTDLRQVFQDVPLDQAIEVREGAESFTVLDRPHIRLAGGTTAPTTGPRPATATSP